MLFLKLTLEQIDSIAHDTKINMDAHLGDRDSTSYPINHQQDAQDFIQNNANEYLDKNRRNTDVPPTSSEEYSDKSPSGSSMFTTICTAFMTITVFLIFVF